eukprot:CAMPEP_0170749628 /NCGR_PEP_ID=MMETSP0437-20130122/10495_1 /TAXON_ID=0 /ORGANISM="Sexangularia sp." /LENGTH=304 /DNA_ID=CAMNT_0011088561 /DNA_START=175 /DNA_END=1089 /DNA_ORIENTATION=-
MNTLSSLLATLPTPPEVAVDNLSILETQPKEKTELCRAFMEGAYCKYGNRCKFAHGHEELRPVLRHSKYKSVKCRSFHETGACAYGQRCRFIHNEASDRVGPNVVLAKQAKKHKKGKRARGGSDAVSSVAAAVAIAYANAHHNKELTVQSPEFVPASATSASRADEVRTPSPSPKDLRRPASPDELRELEAMVASLAKDLDESPRSTPAPGPPADFFLYGQIFDDGEGTTSESTDWSEWSEEASGSCSASGSTSSASASSSSRSSASFSVGSPSVYGIGSPILAPRLAADPSASVNNKFASFFA